MTDKRLSAEVRQVYLDLKRIADEHGTEIMMPNPEQWHDALHHIAALESDLATQAAALSDRDATIRRLEEALRAADALAEGLADATVHSSLIWHGPYRVKETDEFIKYRAARAASEGEGQ